MKRSNVAMVAVLLCTAAPFAAGQGAAQQAGASAALAQLDAFVVDGTCSATMPAMGNNPARTSTGKVHGEKTLDGHWVVIHYEEDQTAANPKPFRVSQYIGYDPAAKHFVSVEFDNADRSYITGTSPGWTGNTATFDETILMDGKRTQTRDVFTKGQSGMATHAGMLRDESGKWIEVEQETCHTP